MVLGKHNARAKALAQKIALALGNALVAPVVAYVPEGNVQPPTAHMRFPGTITVPDAVFERMLESAAGASSSTAFATSSSSAITATTRRA
jgi:creatinine amidohydrolase/Fe(II)-dependent formamide hydrolase-like protein